MNFIIKRNETKISEIEEEDVESLLFNWKKGVSAELFSSLMKSVEENPAAKQWEGKSQDDIYKIIQVPLFSSDIK